MFNKRTTNGCPLLFNNPRTRNRKNFPNCSDKQVFFQILHSVTGIFPWNKSMDASGTEQQNTACTCKHLCHRWFHLWFNEFFLYFLFVCLCILVYYFCLCLWNVKTLKLRGHRNNFRAKMFHVSWYKKFFVAIAWKLLQCTQSLNNGF